MLETFRGRQKASMAATFARDLIILGITQKWKKVIAMAVEKQIDEDTDEIVISQLHLLQLIVD